jgi:cell wall-associated NlpC family hydrolase
MPTSSTSRHRAPGGARTVLDDAAARTAHQLSSAGRRTVVAAGTSGLVVSMLSGAAAAEVPTEHTGVSTVDTQAVTATARAALAASPGVAVPAEATWSFATPSITVIADPPPAPDPVVRRTADPGVAIPASAIGNAVLEIAARYIGSPYVYGGSTPDGFDCSGFTSYVFAQLGIALPRSSASQRGVGTVVPAEQAQPGDLMWWDGHVAIYAGGNLQIDSSQPGTTVQFREIHRSDPVFIRVG